MLAGWSCWGTGWSAGMPHRGGAESSPHAEAPKPRVIETDTYHSGAVPFWPAPLGR